MQPPWLCGRSRACMGGHKMGCPTLGNGGLGVLPSKRVTYWASNCGIWHISASLYREPGWSFMWPITILYFSGPSGTPLCVVCMPIGCRRSWVCYQCMKVVVGRMQHNDCNHVTRSRSMHKLLPSGGTVWKVLGQYTLLRFPMFPKFSLLGLVCVLNLREDRAFLLLNSFAFATEMSSFVEKFTLEPIHIKYFNLW